MSKYPVGETVRVTNPSHDKFDQVGTVTDDRAGITYPFRVAFRVGQTGELFRASSLTLADPDVHTVLDQMDAESALPQADLGPHFAAIEKSQAEWDAMVTPDPVNHPAHYGGDTTYETIKVIEAWGLGFSIGNCVKYLSRAGKKGPMLEDLRKARFYLDREIDRAEAAQ